MENLLEYIVKSSALLLLFYGSYLLLLRQETFFQSNRWFLLLGLLTSAILPLITFKKIVWIEPSPSYVQWQPVVHSMETAPPSLEIDWLLVVWSVYGFGLLIFLFQLLLDFKHLKSLMRGQKVEHVEQFKLIDVKENVPPFSFFNYIVYNSAFINETEFKHVLAHEQVHCLQKHSFDVLLSRIFCIAFWFNPFVWKYQKAILQNLEFIADTEALKTISDKKSYQLTLLKVTTHENCVPITNPFYQSLIKKRIVMLNKNQSNKANYWKYFIMIPALLAFLLYFQVKVIAQEKTPAIIKEKIIEQELVAIEINKNSTDEELKRDAEALAKEHNIKLKVSKVKRNTGGEIVAIKIAYKDDKGSEGTTQFSGNEPIKPIRLYKSANGAFGFASGADSFSGYGYSISDEGDADGKEMIVKVFTTDDHENAAIEKMEEAEGLNAVANTIIVEATDAPSAEESENEEKRVIIKKLGSGNEKVKIVINDEVIDLDSDKVIAELEPMLQQSLKSLEHLNFQFDLSEGSKIRKKARRDARIFIEKARPEIEKVHAEMNKLRPEIIKKYKIEKESSKGEMEEMKKEMEAAREELKKARIEFEKSKAELDELRAQQKQVKKQ